MASEFGMSGISSSTTGASAAAPPRMALAGLRSPPPPGSIQFFDGYYPALAGGKYSISINQTVDGVGSTPSYPAEQSFTVQAPEFNIDPGIVQMMYPADGSTGVYDQQIPYIVLTDPSLPWERALVPGQSEPNPANPYVWMALLIFAEGEIDLQPGSNNPVSTSTVQDLVAADPNVLKPTFPDGWLSADTLASQCQTIKVTGAAFNAVAPNITDLPYLAHCRAVQSDTEGETLLSVVLANRLALADERQAPKQPLRYYAHLVSLEGYAAYLGPTGKVATQKPTGGLVDVQLVSLANWTFVSLPETGMSFAQIVQGLIDSQAATPVLRLPVASGTAVPQAVSDRLDDGYAPLTFVSGAGEQSFAWYRGPFAPVVPQPLPQVGNPPVAPREANSAAALMIYLAEQGLFDLSYAAAWNIGRELALADANFAQQLNRLRQAARSTLTLLSQRLALPHFAGTSDLRSLAGWSPTQSHFGHLVGKGLGRTWTGALASAQTGGRPASSQAYRSTRAVSRRRPIHPREVLALPGASEAIVTNVGDELDAVAAWIANLALLYPVPFSYVVPDPRMLPDESIRFFYVDQGWIDALVAGALSVAVHGSIDVSLFVALRSPLETAVAVHRVNIARNKTGMASAVSTTTGGTTLTGMLIRSQLVSAWPKLVVTPTLGGAPLPILRSDCPSASVRLCLFQGVPDTVSLAEPYQGLQFGIEDQGVVPRCVTLPTAAGVQIENAAPTSITTRSPASGAVGGVLDTQATAATLETAAGVLGFASGAVINWDGQPLATTVVGTNQLEAVVPAALVANAGTSSITVSSGGATSAAATFTIDAVLAIDEIVPVAVGVGQAGFTLTVYGVGFGPDAVVQWNGTALTTTVVSVMEVTAQVVASLITAAGPASIVVVSGGSDSNTATFTVVGPGPAIDRLAPTVKPAGSTGFTLTIYGTNLAADAVVQWQGAPLATSVVNSQEISAAVPANLIASAGSAAITVMSQALTSAPVEFTIADATPTIGTVTPTVALAGGTNGFTLTVDGVNFAAGAVVKWGDTALTTHVDDTEQVTADVPASLVTQAGFVNITVVSGGVTSNPVTFTVFVPQPTLGLLEPASVVAGSSQFTLTVTGGFGAGDFALQLVRAPERQSFMPA